jgi:PleD family two-component response regulator
MWNTIKHADEALYIAKNTGRDKIVVFENTMADTH